MTQDDYDSSATLYIHPGDRMSKPLRSANVTTSNVLLKITVPKRVRVRRRRKSQGPVLERLDAGDVHEGLGTGDSPNLRPKQPTRGLMTRDTRSLIRNLRNNPSNYQMQIIGPIERTHRFRGTTLFEFLLLVFVLTHRRNVGFCSIDRQHAIHEEDARAYLTF